VGRCEDIPAHEDEGRNDAQRRGDHSDDSVHPTADVRTQCPVRAIVLPVKFSVVTECPLESVCT
jgi:hypothetical protein